MKSEWELLPPGGAASPAELWQLLSRQAALYTMGESTSLREETVRALGGSVRFCLQLALEQRGVSAPPQGVSLEKLFQEGQQAAVLLTSQARSLWLQAQAAAPPVSSALYRDTLAELGLFFQRYDPYFFAQELPCSIDYPLCCPVEDSLEGAVFVQAYLRRLLVENRLCAAFPRQSVAALGKPYRGKPLNLCEAVLTSALGLVLAGEKPWPLVVKELHRARLASALSPLSADQRRTALEEAGRFLLRALGEPEGAAACLRAVTASLLPRLEAALAASASLQGVFPGPGSPAGT